MKPDPWADDADADDGSNRVAGAIAWNAAVIAAVIAAVALVVIVVAAFVLSWPRT